MGHGTKLIQQIIFLFICNCFGSERAVDLNDLRFQFAEIMEIRVSGSKVIQCKTDSHPPQFCEKMLLIYILFQKVTLCQFHDQGFQRQPGSFHFPTDILDHIRLGCLNLRNINTYSELWNYFPDFTAFSHNLPHHPSASRNNKSCFFQNRNKLCR